MVDPMSPAAAALMRPAGVAPALASPPAAVLADPAVALDLQAEAQAVPADCQAAFLNPAVAQVVNLLQAVSQGNLQAQAVSRVNLPRVNPVVRAATSNSA